MGPELIKRHTRPVIWLHWLMAAALVGMVIFGLIMSSLPLGHAARPWMMGAHLATGLLIFTGAIFRLRLRRAGAVERLPAVYRAWERALANSVHALFYGLMFGLPALGFMVWLLDPFVPGPGLAGQSLVLGSLTGWLHWLHYLGAWLLLSALVVHVIGALRGSFSAVPERRVLKRMLPGRMLPGSGENQVIQSSKVTGRKYKPAGGKSGRRRRR